MPSIIVICMYVITDFTQYLVHVAEILVTCASCPLVSPNMRTVVGVDLAMFWGRDIQATVPLDGNLKGEEQDVPHGSVFKHAENMLSTDSLTLVQLLTSDELQNRLK